MKNKNTRNWFIFVAIFLLVIVGISFFGFSAEGESELKSVKSEEKLERICEGEKISEGQEVLINIIGMPFSALRSGIYSLSSEITSDSIKGGSNSLSGRNPVDIAGSLSGNTTASSTGSSSKDYSTTNIQVENVDEADITKTDGDYIYSISDDNVVITDVRNPKQVKVASKIQSSGNIPEDLILYGDKLVVIYTSTTSSSGSYYYTNSSNNTVVRVYDITNKEEPKMLKQYSLYEPYYTSRCIDNRLYVISSGYLRKENDKIVTYYSEDWKQKEIGFDNIKYLEDVKTKKQTLISMLDLDDVEKDIKVKSYLIDISNAYVSENNIYLLDEEYGSGGDVPPISSLFGIWGAMGPFKYDNDRDFSRYTKIYKFAILEDGTIQYERNAKIKGRTINQYSIDEYQEKLRLALYDNDGSRVIIFDKNLNEIGKTTSLAKGEKMYSSRFMGNKAYLVTYKTVDPLYVIDLSDATNPKVLGELKIPGYSTYLHPYDENHLIGIGMETQEVINRNSNGRVTSTTAKIVGMKMALFDVSNVNNPIQMASVVIGDRRTTSAILTNPKALLFSKERELIAIPVNNYAEDFSVTDSSNYSTVISNYTNYQKRYLSEGYAVYKINLTDGIQLKGMITHEGASQYTGYQYRTNSKLLRGLYIDENLYTISENQVKVNNLDTLELVDEIDLKTRLQTKSTTITGQTMN